MADLNFLSEIKESEQQAADMIGLARKNAKLLQDDAQRQAADLMQGAREDAIALQQQLIRGAEKQAAEIILSAHDRALTETAAQSVISGKMLDAAAHMLVERIVNKNAHR